MPWIRWLTFNTVGLLGMAIQLATLAALTETLRLDYLIATGLAVEVAILHNFAWHERWTWRDRRMSEGRWRRLASFNLVCAAVSVPGNVLLTACFTAWLHVHYLFANLLAVAICSLATFAASDRIVFAPAAGVRLPRGGDTPHPPGPEETSHEARSIPRRRRGPHGAHRHGAVIAQAWGLPCRTSSGGGSCQHHQAFMDT